MVRLLVQLALGAASDGNNNDKGSSMFSRAEGAVLVFMPGVPEITRLIQLLEQTWNDITAGTSSSLSSSSSSSSPPRLRVLPLHGNCSRTLHWHRILLAHPRHYLTLLFTLSYQATFPPKSNGACSTWLDEV